MKLGIKSLCAIGALLLCSQNVSAATIEVSDYGMGQSKIIVKGEIRKGEKLSLPNDPFTVVRIVTFDNNKLKEFTPEMKNWLEKQRGVTVFSIQDNEFGEFPAKIFEWFPNLESVHFWGNRNIKSDPRELLCHGNLKIIDGPCNVCVYSREGLDVMRQNEINRHNKEIMDMNNLISEREEEISSLQDQIKALEEQKLDLRKSKKSNRQKSFLRKDINKSMKDSTLKLAQTKEKSANLHKKKEDFEGILRRLEEAQKKSLEIGKKEDQYRRNLWKWKK